MMDENATWLLETLRQNGGWAEDFKLRHAARISGHDVDAALRALGPEDVFADQLGLGGVIWRLGPRPEWSNSDTWNTEPPEATRRRVEQEQRQAAKADREQRNERVVQVAKFRDGLRRLNQTWKREKADRATTAAGRWKGNRPVSIDDQSPDRFGMYEAAVQSGSEPLVAAASAGLKEAPRAARLDQNGSIRRVDGGPLSAGTYAYRKTGDRVEIARLSDAPRTIPRTSTCKGCSR